MTPLHIVPHGVSRFITLDFLQNLKNIYSAVEQALIRDDNTAYIVFCSAKGLEQDLVITVPGFTLILPLSDFSYFLRYF